MRTPYRPSPSPEGACEHTQTCCGVCHAAVGGCLIGLVLRERTGREYPAGASMDRPTGTRRRSYCTTHGRWELATADSPKGPGE